MVSIRILFFTLLALTASLSHHSYAAPARFIARLQGGNFVEGTTLSDWHAPDVIPKLEGQALLDPGNPFRWLIDRSLPPPAPPESFVEFVTGDRLPGVVFDFRGGDESFYSPLPPHFLVRYSGTNPANLESQSVVLRVDVRYVKRIVWQPAADRDEPRMAILREGNRIRFRSARFGAGTVNLLVESGVRRISFSEIAELHLATGNFWSLYWDELSRLAPDGQRRLLQQETTTGLIATTSLDRYLPRAHGDARDIQRWIHGIQPVWSFDLIWVPQGSVWMRRSFAPHEVPLPRVPVTRAEQRSALGEPTFRHAINRNADGGPLRATNRESGWGFGVHAFSELEFEFPALARNLRSEFAIDVSMQDGGCVMARVINASAGNAPLYQGPILVGSSSVLDTGPLGISGSGDAPRRIVLQVDPVLTNRPANADPLDIRDHANWLDPTVEFDAGLLKQQIDARIHSTFSAWNGWELAVESGGQLKRSNFFAEAPAHLGDFQHAIGVTGAAIKLNRTFTISAQDRWLVVDAVRAQPSGAPTKLAIKVGEQMPTEIELPVYDKGRSDYRPLVLPLADAKAKPPSSLTVEVRQLPTPDSSPVLWRAMGVVAQHPMYFRLLEDDVPEANTAASASATIIGAERDVAQKHFGECSFRIAAEQSARLRPVRKIAIRERPQLGEYRFVQFAVRKAGGGGMRIRIHHADEGIRPSIYEAGANLAADPTVKRITNQALPAEWMVITRDLYGDFGNLDLEGLSFEVVGGSEAWIDHVYLARTQNDFNLIK